MTQLLDARGNALRLGEKVGEGGEGTVYRLADHPSYAVKIYKGGVEPALAEKIVMLAQLGEQAPALPAIWPTGLVTNQWRQPLGLLMPLVQGGTDVHNLHTPASRRQYFPRADWRFIARVGANLASAIAWLHELGVVIGDINDGSVLVLPDGTVRLIDVDSFQVVVPGRPPHLCTVANGLFLPPELRGADLRTVVRTKQHDLFGLAVILFKLLMLGRHPFAGRFFGQGDMPIEKAIEQHRFVYGANAARYQMAAPPSAIGLETLPLRVADLFEQAFAPPSPARARPSARAWSWVLDRMAKELVPCEFNPSHFYDWESKRCPWCELERAGLTVFAPSMPASTKPPPAGPRPSGPDPSAPAQSGDEAEVNALLQRAAAVAAPLPTQALPSASVVLANPAAVLAASARRWPKRVTVLLALALVLAATPAVGWLGGLAGCAVVLLGAKAVRPPKAQRPWIVAYRTAKREAKTAEAALRKANTFPRSSAARSAVETTKNQWANVGRWTNTQTQQVHAQQANAQRRRYLTSHRIIPGQIPGVGPGRVDLLAARGIRTAADIAPGRIAAISGFGPALTAGLTGWRSYVESRFAYDPNDPASMAAIAGVNAEAEKRRRTIVAGLRNSVADLEAARDKDQVDAQAAASDLSRSLSVLRLAEANFRAATGKKPK